MKPRKALLVMNPVAGGTDKDGLRQLICSYMSATGIGAHIFETSGENDAENLGNEIAATAPDVVVAVGGDGTVHLAAEGLGNNPQIPLAIIPSGSGNGLSKDLGIPQDAAEALKLLAGNRVRAIDTLRINGRLCIHIADLGFNALVVSRFAEAETRGPATYTKVALKEFLSFEPGHYTINTDTESFQGEAFMITITNARNFGSNATVNPNAVMNDGVFEICILEPFPKPAAVGILVKMYTEAIDSSAYSRIISCREATISCREEELLQIDGEPMPMVKEVQVSVQPKSLKVLVPE